MQNEKVFEFLKPGNSDLVNYSHRTMVEANAIQIMSNGFDYVKSLYNTTDPISNDPAQIKYWFNIRKQYGKFVVVISISKNILEHYACKLSQSINCGAVAVEEVLCEKTPFYDDEEEEYIFTLPKQFIKGYVNSDTGEIIENPEFNPLYDSPQFKQNIDRLIMN